MTAAATSQTGTSGSAGDDKGIPLPCFLICPADITQSNDLHQCGAVVTFTPRTVGTCGTVVSSPASGSFFPVGTTSVTCTAQFVDECTFNVTVEDTEPPTITCPANITVSNTLNQCGAVVNFPAPTASDNCPGVTVVASPASGSFFPKGTTTVNATATDSFNNTATCSFTVTVQDTQPPAITCPANITVSNDPDQCGATVTYSPPTATDNCPNVTVMASPASGDFFPVGTTTVTGTATDATGNDATCTFTITVQDTQAPVITCPDDVAVLNDAGLAGAIVNFDSPIASDNCPGVTVVSDPPSGSTFPIGTTTVTYTASDTSADSPDATCTFDVTVNASIDVKRPSGGDLLRGFGQAVRWKSIGNLGDNVKIDLYRNGNFVSTIKESTPNDGKQRWKVSDTLPAGRGYRIKVTSIDVPSIFGESDLPFRIRASQ